MPKNKSELDRSEKRQAILSVARRMLVEVGYDVSSMGRIAEEAGIAPNTIYWYFADKDALLTGVLNLLVADAAREYQERRRGPLEAHVLWLVGVLEGLQKLIATVHVRALTSDSIRTWHDNFHKLLETTLAFELRSHGVPQADLEHASRVGIFVVEGLLAHPSSNEERAALVSWLVSVLGKAVG